MVSYVVERTVVVEADPSRVHELVADLHRWTSWSPWEGLDPDLRREYAGPPSGTGASYSWDGNRKAGRGHMEITGDDPDRVEVAVSFEKPFASTSTSTFLLHPTDRGTEVTWRMTGEQTGLMGVLGRVVPMDKIVGKDFERGLTRLKAVAEEPPA